VRHAAALIGDGRLGELTNYRGRFFSMYGSDPLGLLSWRFAQDEGGYGVTSDLLSHALDMALMLVGPIARVVGTRATVVEQRPVPQPGAGHYGRGAAGDPTGQVTNEDYVGALAVFESGVHGTFEASRTLVGPESQMAFDVYGRQGALSWSLERLNELRLHLPDDGQNAGYTTILGGDRFPYHGSFAPGGGNGIGFEDVIAIEDYEFLNAVARGEPHEPGFDAALDVVAVQAALIRSWESGSWEEVVPVTLEATR
jgi:predicted dehydrogenase